MPGKPTSQSQSAQKKKLGKLLMKCRGETSLRKIADQVGLSPSNLKYIEDGVNAPTGEVFGKLISVLKPDVKTREKMDELYMTIRKLPPPDICTTIINNPPLIEAMRTINGKTLEKNQVEEIKMLLTSFAEKGTKGESENAENI